MRGRTTGPPLMSDRSKTLTLMAACVQVSLAVTAWTLAFGLTCRAYRIGSEKESVRAA